jgi:peptidoglycan/LPS O-acetylase OafA/YrhL
MLGALSSALPGGWAGVDIFFVLSDFLVTQLLRFLVTQLLREEIEQEGAFDFRAFYLRRILRLTPALACLLIAELCFELLTTQDQWLHLRAALVSALYVTNWNELLTCGRKAT